MRSGPSHAPRSWPRVALKPTVFCLALVPLGALLFDTFADRLSANPIEDITHRTGDWALRLLLLTLAVTPLRRLSGWQDLARVRRMLGLFAFFYACLHLLTYVVLDQSFAWQDILADVVKRPYVTLGFAGFLTLLPLAATSTDGMLRRLGGRRWKRLHRLAYVAPALAVLHFLWLVKADLREPLVYATVLAVLLLARAPPLAERTTRRRAAATRRGAARPTA